MGDPCIWIVRTFLEHPFWDACHCFSHHILNIDVITEISSALGDKNSASSTQENSHSWNKINSTAQKKGQNYTKWPKNYNALLHPLDASACARDIFVHWAHRRGCGVQNPRACQTVHLWNWSASQPLMDRLPSRFDTKSELNPRGGAGQKPNCALKSPSSHSKEVA
jgi:hypothetical protein